MCVCVYTYQYFFPLLPWYTKERVPFIQSPDVGWHWDIPSDPCHQLYLLCPGAEASAALPTAVVSICGEGQTWKHLVLLKCGKTLVLQELQAAAHGTEWTDQWHCCCLAQQPLWHVQ